MSNSRAYGALGLSTVKCESWIQWLALFPPATGLKYNMECQPVVAWNADRGPSACIWGWRRHGNLNRRGEMYPAHLRESPVTGVCARGHEDLCMDRVVESEICDGLIHVHSHREHWMFSNRICDDVDRLGHGRVRHGPQQGENRSLRFPEGLCSGLPLQMREG